METREPLHRFTSIKVKLGLLVALSVVVALLFFGAADHANVPWWLTVPVTLAAALGASAWLARGMTAPLRRMTVAARDMARGDYRQRVETDSTDEVGLLARSFNRMSADLAAADDQRRHLVATVSHELRTPLAAQRALLENLADGVVPADPVVLGRALRQAERLSGLVEDLLDLSRLEAGTTRLDLTDVSVADLVDGAVAEATLAPRPVRYAVLVTPADLTVRADPRRLAQILANLLDNAARHSPADGLVTVTASAPTTDDPPDSWRLEVLDEGEGIAPADRDTVFERYGSPGRDANGTTAGGGTGLGLAIARWVAELHGGRLEALSRTDSRPGARLRLTLPRTPPPSSDVSTWPAGERNAPSPAAPPPQLPQTLTPEGPTMPTTTDTPSGPAPHSAGTGGLVLQSIAVEAPAGTLDALFGRLWPEKGVRPQPRLLIGSLAVGALGAAVLPYHAIGLGVLVVLLTAGALVLAAAYGRLSERGRSAAQQRWLGLSALVCLGLASLTVLRADEVWGVLGVAVAGLLITATLVDARTLVQGVLAAAAWPVAGLRGLPLLGRTLKAMSGRRLLWPVLRTLALTLAVLVVFGTLFSAADAVFGHFAAQLVPDLGWGSVIFRGFVWFFVAGVTLAGTYLGLNPPNVALVVGPDSRPPAHAWEWFTPVGALVGIYLAFLAALASVMWGGDDYVQRATGLTYAGYVHQGFGQLVVATFFTLLVIAFAAPRAPMATGAQRAAVRALLIVLGLGSLSVVASALYRMSLYQDAYGFTTLRLFVDVFEVWLGLVIVFVVVSALLRRSGWVPRAALLSGALAVLGLGLVNPNAWVAQHNVERYAASGAIDAWYVASLRADAVPTVAASALPADLKSCVLQWMLMPAGGEGSPWAWNLGRSQAATAAQGVGVDPVTTTPATSCSEVMSSADTQARSAP